jgi:hypothetical protein
MLAVMIVRMAAARIVLFSFSEQLHSQHLFAALHVHLAGGVLQV